MKTRVCHAQQRRARPLDNEVKPGFLQEEGLPSAPEQCVGLGGAGAGQEEGDRHHNEEYHSVLHSHMTASITATREPRGQAGEANRSHTEKPGAVGSMPRHPCACPQLGHNCSCVQRLGKLEKTEGSGTEKQPLSDRGRDLF